MKSTDEPEPTPPNESQLYTVVPTGRTADGLLRAPLSAIQARLPESYRAMVRDVITRRMPPGVVHHDGDLWCTRWVVRWAIRWVAGVMRADAQPLIDAVDAAGKAT